MGLIMALSALMGGTLNQQVLGSKPRRVTKSQPHKSPSGRNPEGLFISARAPMFRGDGPMRESAVLSRWLGRGLGMPAQSTRLSGGSATPGRLLGGTPASGPPTPSGLGRRPALRRLCSGGRFACH